MKIFGPTSDKLMTETYERSTGADQQSYEAAYEKDFFFFIFPVSQTDLSLVIPRKCAEQRCLLVFQVLLRCCHSSVHRKNVLSQQKTADARLQCRLIGSTDSNPPRFSKSTTPTALQAART